jgi:predicted Rossmann fold nucleotide-binding protein DprA/Smf involved in DNA uptake
VKLLALLGGVGTLFHWGGKLLMHLLERLHLKFDEPVWAILRDTPKHKEIGTSGDKPFYDRTVDAPFDAGELARRLHRYKWTVVGSLQRLEKRGKIREISGGWVRNHK